MFFDGANHIYGHAQTAIRIGRSHVDSHHNHHSHHIVDVSRRVDKGNASEIEIGAVVTSHPMQVIWEKTMDSVWSDG